MFLLALALQLLLPAFGEPSLPADTINAAPAWIHRLILPGSAEEDRLRAGSLQSDGPPGGWLIRSASTLLRVTSDSRSRNWMIIAPHVRTVWNSDLPFSLNEGGLWAGRGMNTQLSTGVAARHGRVTVVLAPQLLYQQNQDYQTFSRPGEIGRERHEFASPFHFPPESLDLPLRFGHDSATRLEPGQSSIGIDLGPLTIGGGTENLWWGPGLRNGIVMSSNAPGIPHLFLRTREPHHTLVGDFEGYWMLGRLEESPYFDRDPTNDYRSLSGLVVTYSPAFEPGLTLGLSRVVYAPLGSEMIPLARGLDVFRDVGRPASEPGDSLLPPAPDQLFSVFGNWRFPASGFEIYMEWGRYERPASLRDLLEMPNHSQGYTVGGQWARPVRGTTALRLHTEATYLEPSSSIRVRPVRDWYTSRTVPQGYTHKGRVIGASIGPGGSSQWFSADILDGRWQAGSFVGRIRWENQAQYTYFPEFRNADVSLFIGLRGGADLGPVAADIQIIRGIRYNYLFQAQPSSPIHHRGVDIHNRSLVLTLSTSGHRQ